MKLDLMRDMSKSFPKLNDPEKITEMRVWHCKYKSVKDIASCINLRELIIATLPDKSLDFLSNLKNLQYLRIMHFPKVDDLSPISELESLLSLSLSTLPNWDSSGKVIKVKSFYPLSALKRLKHIELFGVMPIDESLDEIRNIPGLETARFSGYSDDKIKDFFCKTKIRNEFNPKSSFN